MTTPIVPAQSDGDMWAGMDSATAERPKVRQLRQLRRVGGPPPGDGDGEVQHRGQLRFAERFIAEHGERLRFVHGIGWHEWDGCRWLEDKERVDLEAAVETVKTALRELPTLAGEERDNLYKDIRKTESASGLEGVTKIASALKPISTASAKLDADPHQFNTPGGTVNLLTGDVLENNRDDLITKVAGGEIGEESDPEWESFLLRILPDEDVRSYVQRLFGYAMLGEVTEHIMPIFTGTGANGKGTLRDALQAAFGDYCIEVDPSILMESKHERHGAFKMRLRGARLVFCSETEKGKRFAEATMKRLVGGDIIEANLMHKNPIQFAPSHLLVMLTNHLPAVSGDDPAVWRRIQVVPFDVVIPEEERDGNLPGRLKKAAPAVLSWVYDGWLDYQEKGGLCPPEAVRVKTQEYQASSDVLRRFMDDRVIENRHSREQAREVFAAWVKWCQQNGEQASSEVEFAKSMTVRGYPKKKTNSGAFYLGLMLATATDDDE